MQQRSNIDATEISGGKRDPLTLAYLRYANNSRPLFPICRFLLTLFRASDPERVNDTFFTGQRYNILKNQSLSKKKN